MKLTLCIDKQPRNNPSVEIRKYQFDIGYPLRSIDDVYDEVRIVTDEDKKLIGTLIRRCYIDKYGVLKKLDEDQQTILDLPNITLFEGDNYVYIKEFTDLNMKIQYLTNAEMNKYFATKMELRTSIQQTMESILLEVSKKADDKEVSAAIKMLADEIALKVSSGDVVNALNISTQLIEIIGNRLKIDTSNFKLDENGKMICSGGKIANFTIESNKLRSPIRLPYNYTNDDINRIKSYIMGVVSLTPAEIQKYDINQDGVVNSVDYVTVQQFVNSGISHDIPGEFVIDTTPNALKVINMYDGSGNLKYYLGYWINKLKYLELESLSVGDISAFGSITAGGNRCVTSPYVHWLNFVNKGSSNYMEINLYNPFADVSSFGVNVWASDKRLKENIKDSDCKALEIIRKIKHREFDYKNNLGHIKIGYIADELEDLDNSLIFEVGEDKIKHPAIDKLIPLLSKAIQEQQALIDDLKKRVFDLERRCNNE